MRPLRRLRAVSRIVIGACILLSPVWLYFLFLTSPVDFPYASSLFFAPLAAAGTALAFIFVFRHEHDLRILFIAGMLLRCAFSSTFFWMGYTVYEGSADFFTYWDRGMTIVHSFPGVGFAAFHPPFFSTNLIGNICGFIMLGTGDALPTLFILFSLAGLWGAYFFYRAFVTAFPSGDRLTYAYLAVLLPSISFWASPVGKDALSQLFIGLAAFGFAKMTRKLSPGSILTYLAGIGGIWAVRPHIAAMLALGGLLPYAFGKGRSSHFNTAAKVIIIPILLAGTVYLARDAATFVGVESTAGHSAMDAVNGLSKASDYGGSSFGSNSLALRIAAAPFLMVRPFVFEISSGTSGVAALEGLGLIYFAWTRRRRVWNVISNHWRHPFVAFILCYTFIFSVAFAASTSNFGILVRERIMMVPLFLMLFCAEITDDVRATTQTAKHSRRFRTLRGNYQRASMLNKGQATHAGQQGHLGLDEIGQ